MNVSREGQWLVKQNVHMADLWKCVCLAFEKMLDLGSRYMLVPQIGVLNFFLGGVFLLPFRNKKRITAAQIRNITVCHPQFPHLWNWAI